MTAPRFLDEIASKFAQLAESSPAKDIEKNTADQLIRVGFGKVVMGRVLNFV
jgi:hypothetical protein